MSSILSQAASILLEAQPEAEALLNKLRSADPGAGVAELSLLIFALSSTVSASSPDKLDTLKEVIMDMAGTLIDRMADTVVLTHAIRDAVSPTAVH
mgnify:FL=1